MDDTYAIYLNRITQMALPQAYQNQVQSIQASTKFHDLPSGCVQAAPVPGYTIITPPQVDESINAQFYLRLHTYQQQLLALAGEALIVPLPLTSLHLTLADLIAGDAYEQACDRNPNYEADLHACIETIFSQHQQQYPQALTPIKWGMHSLIVMPRAIGVALVPKQFSDYAQIIDFRDSIYRNAQLAALEIKQHYHFTAHITLGYFRPMPAVLNRDRLADQFIRLNQSWLNTLPAFVINRAELRKFDDMNRFYRQPNWAKISFR